MEALAYLHALVTLALMAWPCWFAVRTLRLPALNPFALGFLATMPVQVMKLMVGPAVLLDAGLEDTGYQFALLMTNVSSLVQWAGAVFFFQLAAHGRLERYVASRQPDLAPQDFQRVKWLFLAMFWASLILLASAEFGLLNWVLNPREGYQHYRTGQGHWYALAVNALSVAYVLSVLQRPRPGRVIVTTIVYLALAYLLGSKGNLLSIFVSSLTFLWFLRWKHLGKVTLVGMPLLFSLLVVNLVLALGDAFELQSVLEYFDYYKNAADYYNAHLSGQLDLMWGEISLTSLWGYVPRALVPDKPSVYGILLVNEVFYPGQAELTNTPAFGGAVELYADFGVLGVAVFSFFGSQVIALALLSYLIFRKPGLSLQRVSVGLCAAVLIQYAPAFGSFLPFLFYAVFLALVLMALSISRRLRNRRRGIGAK